MSNTLAHKVPVSRATGNGAGGGAVGVLPAVVKLEPDQSENEFRNIKLKLKGPNRHSELQAVKALMAMSAQNHNNLYQTNQQQSNFIINNNLDLNMSVTLSPDTTTNSNPIVVTNNPVSNNQHNSTHGSKAKEPMDLSQSESPEPVYGLSISMTEEEFRDLAAKEGIKDVIGEPICKLCNGLFSGPLGIALHMCPAMKRQTYRCEICGEDKWKTKANLHSHIKWCKKRLSMKNEGHLKQIY